MLKAVGGESVAGTASGIKGGEDSIIPHLFMYQITGASEFIAALCLLAISGLSLSLSLMTHVVLDTKRDW